MHKIEPFEKHAFQYENWFEDNKFAYESELLAVKKVLTEDRKTIEIGVGSARFASPLGIKMGIDPSKKMLKLAQDKGIIVLDAVAENLPFREATFHFALMVTTICFVENLLLSFKEALKILEPGGSLIIGFIDKNSLIGKLYQERKSKSVFYQSATFFSTKEIVFYLKKAGFRTFEFFQTIFHDLKEIHQIEPVKKSHGEGSFVVIKASK
ncbi:MAG: class I SAM-dependent methyltransferase [Promethearchaeota archaeon]|nr:MAG: class I SAM-dependent methyltransferase [Candidatus Lokiarchaeota archaeon]